MILLYFYFIFLLYLSYLIHTDEILSYSLYKPIQYWVSDDDTKNLNFFIKNEVDSSLLLQKCINMEYTSNLIEVDNNTFKIALYKNHIETVFSVRKYYINYENLLKILTDERISKINSMEIPLDKILLLEFNFEYGDPMIYHECFRYLKNNYIYSIEKSKRISYKQDLIIYKPKRKIKMIYNNNNIYHIPFMISLFYTNRKIEPEYFISICKITMHDLDDPILRYQFLILMINYFSFNRIKYKELSIKENIDNIIFYIKLKLAIYNIVNIEKVSEKYINAYKTLAHSYINRIIYENVKEIFTFNQCKLF